jgi:hypothetical protein
LRILSLSFYNKATCFNSLIQSLYYENIANFVEVVKDYLLDKQIFKEMGAGKINVKELFGFLIRTFNLK